MALNAPLITKDKGGYSVIITDSSREYADGVRYNYEITFNKVRQFKFLFWTLNTTEEFDCYLYRPKTQLDTTIAIKFTTRYSDLLELYKNMGLTSGKRPAGYGFIPSGHV